MVQAVVKRLQGRPVRGEGDVGRDRLIDAARTLLRSGGGSDLSRKAVAEIAGVTPALISYYFPEKNSLVSAAVRPVIEQRLAQLDAILDAPGSRAAKLRDLIALFIGFNAAEGSLLDCYIALCKTDEAGRSKKPRLHAARRRLTEFYNQGVEAGEWRPLDADLFFLALWGMCKCVAQAKAYPGLLDSGRDAAEPLGHEIDLVLDLAVSGMQRRA